MSGCGLNEWVWSYMAAIIWKTKRATTFSYAMKLCYVHTGKAYRQKWGFQVRNVIKPFYVRMHTETTRQQLSPKGA